MKIQLRGKTEARRLELDGYERVGDQMIRGNLDDLREILDLDDVTVKDVTLYSNNGGSEGDIVDQYVREGVASDHGGTIYKTVYSASTIRNKKIKSSREKVLTAYEERIIVHEDFEKALFDGPITEDYYDEDSFREARDGVSEAITESIEENKEAIASLQKKRDRISEMGPEAVEN